MFGIHITGKNHPRYIDNRTNKNITVKTVEKKFVIKLLVMEVDYVCLVK